MSSPIYLEVCAGLGNRIRAAISGICGAEDLRRPIVISWPVEPSCGALWDDLFDIGPSHLPSWITIRSVIVDPMSTMCLSPEDWKEQCKKEKIVIKSYGKFHQSDPARWLSWLRKIKPRPETIKALNLIFMDHNPPPVGVHIRRTDHVRSIKDSPTEAFITRMKSYPEDTRFFVATDSEEEWATLLQHFPAKRLLRIAYILRRNSRLGMKDAVLDFFGLVFCSEILGSSQSSFSELAAAYAGIPLIQIRDLKH